MNNKAFGLLIFGIICAIISPFTMPECATSCIGCRNGEVNIFPIMSIIFLIYGYIQMKYLKV